MIERLPIQFTANHRRVALLYFRLQEERIRSLIHRIQGLDDAQIRQLWNRTEQLFCDRHRDFHKAIQRNAELAIKQCSENLKISHEQKMLLGAYLSKEYSTQSAALFNPTIVSHPDQSDVPPEALRFIICLRSTGEGHISSITFREGLINSNGDIQMDIDCAWQSLGDVEQKESNSEHYRVIFDQVIPLQERLLFPVTSHESIGMEDLRMVDFGNDHQQRYVGSFTAYDGKDIRSKILTTDDFRVFDIQPLRGRAATGKGIAIFPRKIRDQYVAIGRQDGVNMTIMYSNSLLHWDHQVPLQEPGYPFEFTQLGNCGSPIETREGWLLLTHAVGPLRRYVLSATLLDLEEPHRVIAKLDRPLMEPTEAEREGYVPNVLYSCGWLRHEENIYLPYAYSDQGCSFAKINIDHLLNILKR